MFKFKELTVYKKAFALAMEIFEVSKTFPPEERFDLTMQIRKSSRSVCTNVGEGYRKRQYEAHFKSKISDADMENSETSIWSDFAYHCGYISKKINVDWNNRTAEIGRLLNHMIENPEKYKRKSSK